MIVEVQQQPRPWWYRLLARIAPGRCREIPEADNPTWCEHKTPITDHSEGLGHIGYCETCNAPPRIVLRQFSIIKRYWYLQNFGCAEDARYLHSHPYKFMIAIGLWGSYTERRMAGVPRRRSAPYLYTLDDSTVHHVQAVSPGHTSLFIGFGRAEDGSERDKRYYGAPRDSSEKIGVLAPLHPLTLTRSWKDHIRRKVARI